MSDEKIDSVISENRVKLHIFEPSQRKIWTVVGKEKEYWLDQSLTFAHVQAIILEKWKEKETVII